MTYFYEVGDIILEGEGANVATISVESQANMLVGDSYLIADKFTVDEQTGDDFDFETDVGSIGGQAGKNSAVIGFGLSYDFSETCIGYFEYTAYIYESLITHSLNLSLGIKF